MHCRAREGAQQVAGAWAWTPRRKLDATVGSGHHEAAGVAKRALPAPTVTPRTQPQEVALSAGPGVGRFQGSHVQQLLGGFRVLHLGLYGKCVPTHIHTVPGAPMHAFTHACALITAAKPTALPCPLPLPLPQALSLLSVEEGQVSVTQNPAQKNERQAESNLRSRSVKWKTLLGMWAAPTT